MRTTVKSVGWQKLESSQELATAGLLWEMYSLAVEISCFLWREHLLKTQKCDKEKKPGTSMIFWRNRVDEIAQMCIIDFFSSFPTSNLHLSAINYWHYVRCTNKGLWEIVKIAVRSKRPPCSINYALGACLITWSTTLANKPWLDLLIIKMQSNLLPVCRSDWTWRGAVCQPGCLSYMLLPTLRHTQLVYHCAFRVVSYLRRFRCYLITMYRMKGGNL